MFWVREGGPGEAGGVGALGAWWAPSLGCVCRGGLVFGLFSLFGGFFCFLLVVFWWCSATEWLLFCLSWAPFGEWSYRKGINRVHSGADRGQFLSFQGS